MKRVKRKGVRAANLSKISGMAMIPLMLIVKVTEERRCDQLVYSGEYLQCAP